MERVQIGDCVLFHGSCLDFPPEVTADALVTDPVWPNCPPDLLQGGDDPHGLWSATMDALPPSVHRLVAVMRCDSDPRFLAPVPGRMPFFRSIQLSYAMPSYINRVLGGDETAYWFGSVVARVPGHIAIPGRGPIAQPSDRRANGHPCSRAQVHFDWLVQWCTDAGETVVDPFMGSGTTGVACVKVGRPFVGMEVERRFFDIACRRVEEAYRQADLFVPPPAANQSQQLTMLDRSA